MAYDELGFALPVEFRPTASGARPSEGAIIPPVNRRDLLSAAGTAAVLSRLPWLASSAAASPAGTVRVGDDQVEELRETLGNLDALDQRFGGNLLWRSAQHTLHVVHDLLDRAQYTDQIGAELHGIAGSLTTSLGWYCYDAELQERASVFWSQALNTALLSGDDALTVRTLANMSRQAVDLGGKARDAVRYAQLAARHAGRWAPARVHSLLAVREAQGYARLGDVASANEAITRAWRAFEKGSTDRDPQWTLFLNEAELTCLEGMCRSDLGQHGPAVGLLDRSAQMQDTAHDRNRGMCLVRLSSAALSAGDLDHSVEAADQSVRMIGNGMASARNKRVLLAVAGGLRSYEDEPRARETVERITACAA
ncbi:hypothetical protein [Kitasatospora sp. NPDC002965]